MLRSSRRRLIGVLTLAVSLSLAALTAPAAADEGGDGVAHLARLVNDERAAAGLPAQRVGPALHDQGAAHSARMAAVGDLFHNDDLLTGDQQPRGQDHRPERGQQRLARRRPPPPDASDGHRANTLSGAFDHLGSGVVRAGSTWYVTEVFVQPCGWRGRPASRSSPKAWKPSISSCSCGCSVATSDRDIRNELFRRFSRLGSRHKGMGVGLYLSRLIVDAHGGQLTYAPAEGGGSVFTVALPLAGS